MFRKSETRGQSLRELLVAFFDIRHLTFDIPKRITA